MEKYYDNCGRVFVKTGNFRKPIPGEYFLHFNESGSTTVKKASEDTVANYHIVRELLPFETHPISEIAFDNVCKEESFASITSELFNLYQQKNTDYGDSFSKLYERYGLKSTVIRLYDKMFRLERLSLYDSKVKDESVRDTLMDIANYAILTIMELDRNGCGSEDQEHDW